jgi:hypothetical protein
MHLEPGGMKKGGSGTIARRADPRLPWLNLWVSIKAVSDFYLAVVAAHVGVINEPPARSAKMKTIDVSRL